MKSFEELLEDLQDKSADIHFEKREEFPSELLRLQIEYNEIYQELNTRFKEQYNQL